MPLRTPPMLPAMPRLGCSAGYGVAKGRKPREDKLRVRHSAVRPPETSLPESDRESEDVGVSTRTFAGAGSERWAATRWLVAPGFARPP